METTMMPNLNDYVKALLFGLLLIFAAGSSRADVPTDTSVLLASPAGFAVCSATVIAPDTILTAAHCVEHVAWARTADGQWHAIYGGKLAENIDGAVLYARGVACPCAPVSGMIVRDDPVRATGFPSGEWSDTEGTILDVVEIDEEDFSYSEQIDIINTAWIAPGSSGGGLWQKRGDEWVLIGITVHGFCDFFGYSCVYGATPVWTVLR